MNLRHLLLPIVLALSACATFQTGESTGQAAGARLSFSHNPARMGDPVAIRIAGLAPGQAVVLHTERNDLWGRDRNYRARARFRADRRGRIDTAVDAPVEAIWDSADIDGPFWSMRASDRPLTAELNGADVGVRVEQPDGTLLARATLELRNAFVDLVEHALGPEFPGAFLVRPDTDERLPALVVLGGSEGGDMAARRIAPILAGRGYAVVGYPYYSPSWGGQPSIEGLPSGFANLPLDKLIGVRDWLRNRPGIHDDRIGLYGVSKGAEFVLAAASRIDGFAAVAAIVPSDVIWEGWGPGSTPGRTSGFSWKGEPLDFVPYVGMSEAIASRGTDDPTPLRVPHAQGREAHPEAVEAARIRVEDIDEPVFLLGGGRDRTWDSGRMAARIAGTRADAGLPTETLVFAAATHGLSGPPQFPSRTANARARKAAWPALLAFLERHLAATD